MKETLKTEIKAETENALSLPNKEKEENSLMDVVEGLILSISTAAILATNTFPTTTQIRRPDSTRNIPRRSSRRRGEYSSSTPLVVGEIPAEIRPNLPFDSQASPAWEELNNLVQYGKKVDLTTLKNFVEAIREDPRVDINFGLVLHLLEFNTEISGQQYLGELTLATDARQQLGDGYKTKALEAIARSHNSSSSSEVLLSLARSDRPRVRNAAVETLLTNPELTSELKTADLVRLSRSLSRPLLKRGFQVPIAKEVTKRIIENSDNCYNFELLFDIEMSILHTLETIDIYHPQLLKELENVPNNVLQDFIDYAVEEIATQRTHYERRVIFGPGVRLIGATNWEEGFSKNALSDLAQRFDMNLLENFKATKNEEGIAFKDRYLSALLEAVDNDNSPLVIDHFMHGGSNHSWFQKSGAQRDYTDKMRHPRGISYVELAETLVKPQLEEVIAGQRDVVDLGHVSVLLDACKQYTVAKGTLEEINNLATRAGVKIEEMPLLISVSQKERLSWIYPGKGRSKVQELILRKYDHNGSTLTLGGFNDLDRMLRVRMVRSFDTHGYTDPYDVRYPDPAIFSPQPQDLNDFVLKGLEKIGAQKLIDINKIVPDTQRETPYLLELGRNQTAEPPTIVAQFFSSYTFLGKS